MAGRKKSRASLEDLTVERARERRAKEGSWDIALREPEFMPFFVRGAQGPEPLTTAQIKMLPVSPVRVLRNCWLRAGQLMTPACVCVGMRLECALRSHWHAS